MGKAKVSCTVALVLMAALAERGSVTQAQAAGDTVVLSNTSGSASGILVNGVSGKTTLVYKSFTSTTGTFDVGQLTATPAGGNDEILAFTGGRPVAQTPVSWTSGGDSVQLPFADEISIPVTFWIVWGNPDAQKLTIGDMLSTTVAIWKDQGMGVAFSAAGPGGTRIVDATTNQKAPSYYSFDCTSRSAIQKDIGVDNNRINVYLVQEVAPNGVGWGDSCGFGTGFVAIASAASTELLAHELGHNFMLTHVDGLQKGLAKFFNDTAVMCSASDKRRYFTQGELFRAHFWSGSALNAIYAARKGQITRDCQPEQSDQQCPPIQKRIWAQGKFKAN